MVKATLVYYTLVQGIKYYGPNNNRLPTTAHHHTVRITQSGHTLYPAHYEQHFVSCMSKGRH